MSKLLSSAFIVVLASLLSVNQVLAMSTQVAELPSASPASTKEKSAVIIGAGPVGLAASLMLEKCGFTDITIIEKRPAEYFGTTFAYSYMLDGRGQKCTNLLGATLPYLLNARFIIIAGLQLLLTNNSCANILFLPNLFACSVLLCSHLVPIVL